MNTKYRIFLVFLLFLVLPGWGIREQGKEFPPFEQPILITSAGQSAEVQLASVLAKRAGLDATVVKTAEPSDLPGRKTLVLVLGASLKGLGAAGIDVPQEKERVKRLVIAAREQKIPLVCLHLGGEARRGQLTDQLIEEFLPFGRMALVVKSGNKDGLFTQICTRHQILLIEVEKTVEAMDPLKNAFTENGTDKRR